MRTHLRIAGAHRVLAHRLDSYGEEIITLENSERGLPSFGGGGTPFIST